MAKMKKKKHTAKRPALTTSSAENTINLIPIKYRDKFTFRCSQCGECCREVENSIMLESLDLFRLSRFFKETGASVQEIEDVLTEHTTIIPLTDAGFPVFFLKTKGGSL